MRIMITEADGVSIVRIAGDLRIGGVAEAKSALVALLASGDDIRLDLGALEDCDTAGIQLLLMTAASVCAKGRKCSTISATDAFQAALNRVGIPVQYFLYGTDVRDPGKANSDQA
jgi:anti-anti-sigma regulatory factor